MKTICSHCEIEKECPQARNGDALMCPVSLDISDAYLGTITENDQNILVYDRDKFNSLKIEIPLDDSGEPAIKLMTPEEFYGT